MVKCDDSKSAIVHSSCVDQLHGGVYRCTLYGLSLAVITEVLNWNNRILAFLLFASMTMIKSYLNQQLDYSIHLKGSAGMGQDM
jgi:hypothetical protein